jgi:hypothetical protein
MDSSFGIRGELVISEKVQGNGSLNHSMCRGTEDCMDDQMFMQSRGEFYEVPVTINGATAVRKGTKLQNYKFFAKLVAGANKICSGCGEIASEKKQCWNCKKHHDSRVHCDVCLRQIPPYLHRCATCMAGHCQRCIALQRMPYSQFCEKCDYYVKTSWCSLCNKSVDNCTCTVKFWHWTEYFRLIKTPQAIVTEERSAVLTDLPDKVFNETEMGHHLMLDWMSPTLMLKPDVPMTSMEAIQQHIIKTQIHCNDVAEALMFGTSFGVEKIELGTCLECRKRCEMMYCEDCFARKCTRCKKYPEHEESGWCLECMDEMAPLVEGDNWCFECEHTFEFCMCTETHQCSKCGTFHNFGDFCPELAHENALKFFESESIKNQLVYGDDWDRAEAFKRLTYREALEKGEAKTKPWNPRVCFTRFNEIQKVYPFTRDPEIEGKEQGVEFTEKRAVEYHITICALSSYRDFKWPFSAVDYEFRGFTQFRVETIAHRFHGDVSMIVSSSFPRTCEEFPDFPHSIVIPNYRIKGLKLDKIFGISIAFMHDIGYIDGYTVVGGAKRDMFERKIQASLQDGYIQYPFSKRRTRGIPDEWKYFVQWRHHIFHSVRSLHLPYKFPFGRLLTHHMSDDIFRKTVEGQMFGQGIFETMSKLFSQMFSAIGDLGVKSLNFLRQKFSYFADSIRSMFDPLMGWIKANVADFVVGFMYDIFLKLLVAFVAFVVAWGVIRTLDLAYNMVKLVLSWIFSSSDYMEVADYQVEGQFQTQSLALFGMLASLVCGQSVNARNIQTCFSIAASGRNVFEDVYDNMEYLVMWCAAKLTGKPEYLTYSINTRYLALHKEVKEWESINVNWRANVTHDLSISDRVAEFHKRAQQLYEDVIITKAYASPMIVSGIRTFADQIRAMYNYTIKSNPLFGQRSTPIVVYLVGKPGQGKSTLVNPIARSVYRYLQCHYPELVSTNAWSDLQCWARAKNTEYWDGYGGQFAYKIEELCAQQDKVTRGKEIAELLTLVGNDPIPLNMSKTEDKGAFYFTSKMAIISTNFDDFHNTGTTDQNAMLRRLHFPINVEKRSEVNMAEKKTLDEIDLAWNLSIVDKIPSNGIALQPQINPGTYSFKRLIQEIAEAIADEHKKMRSSELVADIDWSEHKLKKNNFFEVVSILKGADLLDKGKEKDEKQPVEDILTVDGQWEWIVSFMLANVATTLLVPKAYWVASKIFERVTLKGTYFRKDTLLIPEMFGCYCANNVNAYYRDAIYQKDSVEYFEDMMQQLVSEMRGNNWFFEVVAGKNAGKNIYPLSHAMVWYIRTRFWHLIDQLELSEEKVLTYIQFVEAHKELPWIMEDFQTMEFLCEKFPTVRFEAHHKEDRCLDPREWTVAGVRMWADEGEHRSFVAGHHTDHPIAHIAMSVFVGWSAWMGFKALFDKVFEWCRPTLEAQSADERKKLPRPRKAKEGRATVSRRRVEGQVDLRDKEQSFRKTAHCSKRIRVCGPLGKAEVYGLVSELDVIVNLHCDYAVGGINFIHFISEGGAHLGESRILKRVRLDDRDAIRLELDPATTKVFKSLSKRLKRRDDKKFERVKGVRLRNEIFIKGAQKKEYAEVSYTEGSYIQYTTSSVNVAANVLNGSRSSTVCKQFYILKGVKGKAGDCGQPVVALVQDGKDLVGIHFASEGNDSFIVPIYYEDFRHMQNVQGQIFLHPSVEIEDCDSIPEIPGWEPLGRLKKSSFAPTASDFEASPLYNAMLDTNDVVVEPTHLSFFRNDEGEKIDPWSLALQKPGQRPFIENFAGVEFALENPEKCFKGFGVPRVPVSPFTAKQVLLGEENVTEGLPLDTSVTYENKVRNIKSRSQLVNKDRGWIDPKIDQEIADLEQAVDEGREIVLYAEGCLKSETLPCERVQKGKARLFFVASYIMCIWSAMYVKPITDDLKKHLGDVGSSVGVNPHGFEWTSLYYRLNELTGGLFGGDCGGWDNSVKFFWTHVFWLWLCMCYKCSPQSRLGLRLRAIARSTIGGVVLRGQYAYYVHCMVFSGGYLTSLVNSFINWCIHVICFHLMRPSREYKFSKHVRLRVYGDDNVGRTSPEIMGWYNMFVLRDCFKKLFGMNYTTPDKGEVTEAFLRWDSLEFLSRKFRPIFGYDGSLVYVTAPLKMESILGMLAWVRSSKDNTVEEQLKINIKTALYEMSLHTKEDYDAFTEKLTFWLRETTVEGVVIPQYDYFRERQVTSVVSVDVQSGMTLNCTVDDVIHRDPGKDPGGCQ